MLRGPLRRCAAQAPAQAPAAHRLAPGPYERVGNVLIVSCIDHPFKHGWEVNRALRDLKLEFKGQTTVQPDIPSVRTRLFHARHLVDIEAVPLDEAKRMLGVPSHVRFTDLQRTMPQTMGRGEAAQDNPYMRSCVNFSAYRRMRMKDVLHRDAVEKRLLAARKAVAAE